MKNLPARHAMAIAANAERRGVVRNHPGDTLNGKIPQALDIRTMAVKQHLVLDIVVSDSLF